jgi:hypothetical protein
MQTSTLNAAVMIMVDYVNVEQSANASVAHKVFIFYLHCAQYD